MELDYNQKNSTFILRVPRDTSQSSSVQEFVRGHGFDFSTTASNASQSVLFTREPYAAVTFFQNATNEARQRLAGIQAEIEASRRKISHGKILSPEGMDLWPFQVAGVEYVLRRSHSLIGDQPGLGKTPMAICVANEIRARRILVVCPANIRKQWAIRIREWSVMNGKYVIYPIYSSRDGVHPSAEWTIISYDLIRAPKIRAALAKGTYDLVVLDEAHYCKTPDAGRTRAIFGGGAVVDELAGRAGMLLALTGTPLPNRPRECYTLARGLCHDAIDWMSEESFRERFNPSALVEKRDPETGQVKHRFVTEKTGRLPELQNRLRANFMVRRMKREVQTQLPDIRYEIQHVEETGAVKKALEAESMLHIDPENLAGVDATLLGHISVVRKMMGMAKMPLVAEYVDMIIDGGEDKLVIFGWHIDVLNGLEERLKKHGLVRVDGSTPIVRREKAVARFQSDTTIKIFLGNIQAVGVGTDGLQYVCSHCVFAENSWTPSDNDQAVSRLERMGQKSGILAEFMVAPNSFDERILGTSLRKLKNINEALDREH